MGITTNFTIFCPKITPRTLTTSTNPFRATIKYKSSYPLVWPLQVFHVLQRVYVFTRQTVGKAPTAPFFILYIKRQIYKQRELKKGNYKWSIQTCVPSLRLGLTPMCLLVRLLLYILTHRSRTSSSLMVLRRLVCIYLVLTLREIGKWGHPQQTPCIANSRKRSTFVKNCLLSI